jgi:DNA-binding protein
MAVAQFDQASISGVVQDTTGAAISNAVMTLTNLDNGFVMKIKTDKKGGYQFSPIKIGHYSLSAAAPNFVKMTMLNIYLHLEDKQDIPFVLKPMQ